MDDYCSASDIESRHTANGYKFVADRDRSGSVSASEQSSYITTAIDWAGGVIDGMIGGRYETLAARSSANQWLKDRCVDLAAYRSATHGGRKCPQSYKDDYANAMDMLRAVRDDGQPVPGLTLPSSVNGPFSGVGIPRFVNVKYR